MRAALTGGLVGAVVAAGVAYGTVQVTGAENVTSASATTDAPAAVVAEGASTLAGEPLDIASLLDLVGPSVANIEIGAPNGGAIRTVAAGSGVVISADGFVLTNAHVVEPIDRFGRPLTEASITVKLADGTTRPANVVGSDSAQDVALLRLEDTTGLQPATLGSSASLAVGDDVVAIGNALGLGDTPTVTKGIVSATGRTLDVDAETTLTDLIQTDAPINHGNSGGALVNAAGEVVGINSAGIPGAQNVGFAIAIDTIKPLLPDLQSGGAASTASPVAYLGVSTRQGINGVEVTAVAPDAAADRAGVRPGDVIVRIDDAEVVAAQDLAAVLGGRRPGDTITLEVVRIGTVRTVSATLGSRTT